MLRVTTIINFRGLLSPQIRTLAWKVLPNRGFASVTGALKVNTDQKPAKTARFTAEKYPEYKRNPKFKQLDETDLSYFRSILTDSSQVLTEAEDIASYNQDWMRKYLGKSTIVLKPKSAKQVSQILKYCNENVIAVCPQGGNTGLVGGSVPVFDEVVISTNIMNNVRHFDEVSGVLVCDAGCVLETLDNYLGERGYIMPLDLGAKGSCHIGGNVATNAGGLRLLRYGSLHGSVLGLEVVLPDGTILDNLSTLRKDNTGYDLKQLFIGSEGSLGMVTGVSILTPRKPKAVNVALLGLSSFENVQAAFKNSKQELSEILSAFEFWDGDASQLAKEKLTHIPKDPLQSNYPFYVLVETSGSNKEHDDEKLSTFLEHLMENNIVQDGVMAQDATQIRNLWSIREGLTEACGKVGAVYKYDISLPVPVLYMMVEDMRARLRDAGVYGGEKNNIVKNVVGYGHIGDGNLHLNITSTEYDPQVLGLIEPYVYEWAAKYKGSISAEHGLGLMKANHLHFSKSNPMIQVMKTLKNTFDPNGIMNPYKFLPA